MNRTKPPIAPPPHPRMMRHDRATRHGRRIGYALVGVGIGAVVWIMVMAGWCIIEFGGVWAAGALGLVAAVVLTIVMMQSEH